MDYGPLLFTCCFDSAGWVVIARLNAEGKKRRRLLGAVPCERDEELPQAAVQAVLAATNRVLGRGLE